MIKKLKEENLKKREMVVRNVKKVKSARPQSAVPKKPQTSQGRATGTNNNRDLMINNSDEEAEAWFQVEGPAEGDQRLNMPGEISPVRAARETIQDRIGRKYKDTINDKVAGNNGKNPSTLGFQTSQENDARFKELMREKKEK